MIPNPQTLEIHINVRRLLERNTAEHGRGLGLWFESHVLSLPLASNWQKIGELIECFGVLRSFDKEVFLKNASILSCFVRLKSVLLNLLVFLTCMVEA